jgi:agmatine deiminase
MDHRLLDKARTPLADGFTWPAEWSPHRRTWMCWPTRAECFGGAEAMNRAKDAYARVARAVSRFEPLIMAARPADAAEARRAIGGNLDIFEVPLDDSWARDIGPTFLKNGHGDLAGVQWRFNAWGNKYQSYGNDAQFATRALGLIGVPVYRAPFTAEGGALATDGEGTALTTEQCLLNANRNPGVSRSDVEDVLKTYLGAAEVIWLGDGFSDDETDGHVDNIACFACPGSVILGMPAKDHPDYPSAMEATRRLKTARDAKGRALEIVELPQPVKERRDWRGRLLATSYVNFYLVNGGVIMPAFDDPNDEPARMILSHCFPDRKIVPVDVLDVVQGGGGIHCITQQEPLP